MNAYQQCLEEMYGLRRFGIILGLDCIRTLLQGLGNPHHQFKSIHIAGTNGKGSVASALAAILHRAGHRVGLYTSPHLVRFNERIRINDTEISDDAVVNAYNSVKGIDFGEREPTFFEYSTAMALHEFARQGVQWAIVETGMGGRLDATNVVRSALTIITNISMEHRAYLGNTLEAIAGEKAGIIKPETPVVTGVRQPAVWKVIKEKADHVKAPAYRLGSHFKVRRNRNGRFTFNGIDRRWEDVQTGLPGNFQIDNAAMVIAAAESLIGMGVALSEVDIREGLLNNRWPGRLETVSESPRVILDGAHNFMAARNLGRYIEENLGNRKITLVIGILDDKPYGSILKSLVPHCRRVILTQARTGRALPAEKLVQSVKKWTDDVRVIPNVAQAIEKAMAAASEKEVVVVAGSLYVVGEAKEYFDGTGPVELVKP